MRILSAVWKRSSLLGLLLASIILYVGCLRGYITVEYVFPDGFRGPAIIRERQPDGVPECEKDYVRRGSHRCVLTFPSSGVLSTQGEAPITQDQWEASARYANGTAIPIPGVPETTISSDQVALWSLGSIKEGENWLFVGTESEFFRFKEQQKF
jgi:hypothetical protein